MDERRDTKETEGKHEQSAGQCPCPMGAVGATDGRRSSRTGKTEQRVMWKPATAMIVVTMAGSTAFGQQQSPIENLDKTITQLAQEGYEIKAAENLSGDTPKFVLQKGESIIICQINFSDGEENCFQLRSRSR
jgi:hypothetical protein